MTSEQYERLPALAKAIVDFDREIRARKAEPVADIKFYRELTGRRAELVSAAANVWGVPLHGDGSRAR